MPITLINVPILLVKRTDFFVVIFVKEASIHLKLGLGLSYFSYVKFR